MKIEATQRLVQAQPIRMGNNFSKTEGVANIEFLQYQFDKQKTEHIGNYKDFSIHLHEDKAVRGACIFALSKAKVVGFLDLRLDSSYMRGINAEVTATYILAKYRGFGLGVALYKEAIKKYKGVASDVSLGISAVRVWQSLAKTYTVQLCNLTNSKVTSFVFSESGIPIIDNTLMTKLKDDYFFFIRK